MNSSNLNEYLTAVMSELNPEQISALGRLSSKLTTTPTPDQAMKMLEDIGIDLEAVRKKIGATRAEEVKNRVKIGANDKCSCGSGLKYKKCCRK